MEERQIYVRRRPCYVANIFDFLNQVNCFIHFAIFLITPYMLVTFLSNINFLSHSRVLLFARLFTSHFTWQESKILKIFLWTLPSKHTRIPGNVQFNLSESEIIVFRTRNVTRNASVFENNLSENSNRRNTPQRKSISIRSSQTNDFDEREFQGNQSRASKWEKSDPW